MRASRTTAPTKVERRTYPAEVVRENMMRAVRRFNTQLERFAELAVVLAVGALLPMVEFRRELLWFIPLPFLVIRPVSVAAGLWGTRVEKPQARLIAWFGIRGIGSIYYLMYAVAQGLDEATSERLVGITLAVVVASVVAHGISVTPLMKRYEKRKKRSSSPRAKTML